MNVDLLHKWLEEQDMMEHYRLAVWDAAGNEDEDIMPDAACESEFWKGIVGDLLKEVYRLRNHMELKNNKGN
jgi:hypothetical protein